MLSTSTLWRTKPQHFCLILRSGLHLWISIKVIEILCLKIILILLYLFNVISLFLDRVTTLFGDKEDTSKNKNT